MTRFADRIRSALPDRAFYRLIAASYRLRPERRLLLLDELVPRGCTAVDVGAWWGPWTYWLSRRAASVWAFEPNPELASFLTRVVSPNVRVENVALSDRTGEETLFAPREVGRDALATLSAAHTEPGARTIEVPLRPLDEYRLEGVQFIKIDVEGHELEVLLGAEETLASWAPTLLVEIDQAFHEQPIQRIFDWLLARGYECQIRRNRTWASLRTFDVGEDQAAGRDVRSPRYINDFLFTPRRTLDPLTVLAATDGPDRIGDSTRSSR
jgi:FkbM family methyltransferase